MSHKTRSDLSFHHQESHKIQLLEDIKTNTNSINLNVDTLEVNTDGLETLITATNTKLDTFSGHSNNTTAIGDGSTQLRVLPLGYNQSAGQVRSLLCDAAGHQQIDVISSALPSGGATEAKQDVQETTLNSIQTAVEIIDNAIDGTEMRCDIIASLPAGTNAIGKLSANSGVDIGDVDVTSLPLTFNSGNKDGTCQRVVVATDDINISAMKASLDNIDNAVDGNYLNINHNIAGTDVDSNSGNKSAATQRVVIATDDVNLSAIKNAVEILDNAIDGTEMRCDIIASLPAGTNAIGKLSANDGIDIGDVDVTSISAGTNRIGKVVLMGNEAVDGSGTERHVLLDSAGHLQVDVLSAPTTAVTNTTLTNLDNCIDTNELQVDIVGSLPAGTNAIGKLSANSGVDIGDVDVTSLPLTFNSGNKDATCQRVVVATDDVNLSAIKSSLDSIDNAVDGNYLNVNQNIAGTDVDSNSGNKSAATQRVVIADDDTNLSAIKTSLDNIDNAVDGNYLNINQNIAGTDVDSNSGNKSAATQRVVIADDDTNLSAIKTSLDNIDNAVDGNYLNVNANIAGTDVDSNSGNKSAATQRVVVATDDVNLSAIKSSLTTIEGAVGLSKVNVNITSDAAGLATSALQGDLNTKIDTIDSQIDLLEGANTIKDVEWLNGATISDQALSDVLDTEGYKNIFIYGENSGSISGNTLKIFGSNLSAGTYYSVGQMSVITSDSGRYLIREDTPLGDMPSPRYLKVFNATGSSQTITKLRAVMSNKLRYV